jgi:nitrate/TMAO reductase-like tetraheme cytochrome c subunit
MTIQEEAKIRAKKANPKKPRKNKVNTPKKPVEKPGEEPKKEAKDLSHIECYRCHEYGHYSTSKECPLHSKNQAKKQRSNRICKRDMARRTRGKHVPVNSR